MTDNAAPAEATAPRPDFFIVGAPKAGTTAMTEYLQQHPQVFMLVEKELHFFGSDLAYRRPRPTLDEYLDHFSAARGALRIGEASVGYLYSERAPAEILAFNPRADALIMLRNPLEMVPSLHAQQRFMGQEDIADLGAALDAEPERVAGRRIPPGCDSPWALRYIDCARYARHVERYLDAFGREHVHVMLFDDFVTDTAASYAGVLAFLGVEDSFRPDFAVVNERKSARLRALQRLIRTPPAPVRRLLRATLSEPARVRLRRALYRLNSRADGRAELDPRMRDRIRDAVSEDVARLSLLIDRDLSHWLT
jgi:hypothetical protein